MIVSRLENGVITKNEADIVFDMRCQVLCVGAGSAGIYAADAAAREGADVILIENDTAIGGMHILGRVFGCYYGAPGGSFEQDSYKGTDDRFNKTTYRIDHKQLKEYDRLKKSGVKLLCEHTPTGVVLEANRVVGLRVFDGAREIFVRSDMVIDATSDGHVLRMIDVAKRYGSDSDGKFAPFSVFSNYCKDGKVLQVNEDAGYIDQYDSRDFSKKAMMAHAKVSAHLEKGDFVHLATHTGVREGLTFDGEESLCCEDMLFSRRPERILFWAYSDLDRHGFDNTYDGELLQNWWVISNLATVTVRIPVPLGAVVPRGIGGIVTAGRCLSADTYVIASVRMNRDMFRMGECVGTAAAMAVKAGVGIMDIDYEEYLSRVRSFGCFDGDVNKSFGFDFPRRDKPYMPVEFDARKNLHLLKTETPGVAIWSCYVTEDKVSVAEELYSELTRAEDTLYKYNLAIALGIMGDKRALPTLAEIVENRDCFYFKDCRRSNQFRSVIAVCLLGRLGNGDHIPMLWQIAFDEREYSREMYHTLEPDYLYYNGKDRNFLYFQMLAHSITSILKIMRREAQPTDEFVRKLRETRSDKAALSRIVYSADPNSAAYVETLELFDRTIDLAEQG